MDKIKIKWKIFGFLLGFSTILLAVFWIFQTLLLDDMYKSVRKNEIKKAIELVEKNIDSPNLNNILFELEHDKEIFARPTNAFIEPLRPPRVDKDKRTPETITREKTFRLPDGRKVDFTFYATITPVTATVSTLQKQLYVITVLMIILSIGFALVISAKISRPIVNLNKSARLLAKGNYDTHFSGNGFLEIAELADTLNTAARELSKTEGLRRELMANISHDLRTPLALIYSYAEMMHDFPNEITPEQTQIIMDETKRLSSLVNDVLDVSRLETGTMKLNLQKYNLTQSIRDTINRMAELLKKDGYEFLFEYSEDIHIAADELKISQVFYNLLINAVNYSNKDKKITIRQEIVDNFVKIEVEDKGDGISKEDLPYIWDRYYKVDKTHKRGVTGTGLGLSIVKKILDLHNALYGVESEKSKGSIFWFCLKI